MKNELTDMSIFALLFTAISSIFYGFVATAAVMAILYFLLKMLSEGIVKSVPFYITGCFLFILLNTQLSLMIGAIKADGMLDAIELVIRQMYEGTNGTFGANDSQQLLDQLTEDYPLLGTYIDTCDFSGHNTTEIASVMTQTFHKYLSSYIWHRVWWSLGLIIVASLIAMMFDKGDIVKENYTKYTYASSYYSDPDNF